MRQIRVEQETITDRNPEVAAYLAAIRNFPTLTPEQEVNLAISAQDGNKDAFDMLVNCNLRFVVSIAKQYNYCRGTLTLLDLINEGNIGLMYAVNTFDVTKGIKLISYAVAYIRKNIINALSQKSRIVRDYNGTSANTYTSLDEPTYEDNDMTKADIYCQTIDKETDESLLTDVLRAMKAILKQREMYVVCNIFGIQTTPVSKYTVAEKLGLTEERVRQIMEDAMTKLKGNQKVITLLIKYRT